MTLTLTGQGAASDSQKQEVEVVMAALPGFLTQAFQGMC